MQPSLDFEQFQTHNFQIDYLYSLYLKRSVAKQLLVSCKARGARPIWNPDGLAAQPVSMFDKSHPSLVRAVTKRAALTRLNNNSNRCEVNRDKAGLRLADEC